MTNREIADQLNFLSRLMDMHGENSFKVKSYSNAAFTISKLPVEISTIDDVELFAIKGIGAAIGSKIREMQTAGKLDLLEQLIAETPAGVIEMMRIKGLGPKKLAIIWKEMGIESLGELEYACHENRLARQKGFGLKTQENVLSAIQFLRTNQGWFLWSTAELYAQNWLVQLKNLFPNGRFEFTGSFRRQVETIQRVEMLTDVSANQLQSVLQTIPEITIQTIEQNLIDIQFPDAPGLRLYSTEREEWAKQLFQTTGSNLFLGHFANLDIFSGAFSDESEIFEKAGLPYIPPALREDAASISRFIEREAAPLITVADIKGIIHSHSTWSDGRNTIAEMAIAAREKGFEYLVISDHSQSAFYANGLQPERIIAQHLEIDELNRQLTPFRIFKGIESDILSDGSLDYSDDVLAGFDLVIASVHSNLNMPQDRAMNRLLRAIENQYTRILGHPTGRLLLSRPGYPVDHKMLIDACVANGVVIEINAHPRRLDLDWRWIDYAMERGAMLSINPDAHFIEGFDDIRFGVMAAQKGGLQPQYNLSSLTLLEFLKFLAK